ncbi:MAG: hypothetical protein JXO22_03560 [Phycisphaerae bacterium]|nr:hypothetical protein [Phycisphaerae bacterium]
MRTRVTTLVLVAICTSVMASAQPTAALTLESAQAGQTVSAGATIDWTVKVAVSTGDNAGLALVAVNLVQDPNNPELFDLPQASEASIAAPMTNFSRPDGISNPGEGGATTGYVGSQRGTAGAMNLIQLGGAQNTFGTPGATMGASVNVIGGVGQSGPQTVVSGSFTAPSTEGTYTFSLSGAAANVLETVNPAPAHSPVIAADADATGASFSFTVEAGSTYLCGDADGDGAADVFDIDAFVYAITHSEVEFLAQYPTSNYLNSDTNCDAAVDVFDIDTFVAAITGTACDCGY